MNKRLVVFFMCLLTASLLVAGGVENKTNLSPGYIRNPSRNTEAKRPEACYYNIAGTSFMEDGLYTEIGNQFVFKEYSNEWNGIPSAGIYGGKTSDDTTVYLYPDADIVFKKNQWAVFANFGVYAGGGHLDYDKGTSVTSALFASGASKYAQGAAQYKDLATLAGGAAQLASAGGEAELAKGYSATSQDYAQKALTAGTNAKGLMMAANNHSLDVTSITYGGQIGFSYRPWDFVSFAFGVRYVHGTQSLQLKAPGFALIWNGSTKIKYNANAYTISPLIGVHFRAWKHFDFSAQYQGHSNLEYEVKDLSGNKMVAKDFGIENGKKFHTDLPTVLNFGAGWQVIDPLYLSLSFNFYSNEHADQSSVLDTPDYDNSFEVAFGADFQLLKCLGLSCGVTYGKQGIKDCANSSFNPVLDNLCFGGGIEYSPTNPLTVTVAGMYMKYFEADYYIGGAYKSKLNKDLQILSVGLTYKLF